MITTQTIESMKHHDEWGGFGYLGERENVRDAVKSGERPVEDLQRVADVDELVAAYANKNGITFGRLFRWANSRPGRHFADCMFGWGDSLDRAWQRAQEWGVTPPLTRP